MKTEIINRLIELTHRANDDVKLAAIFALGDYKATTEQHQAIRRLIELSRDPNREVAISAIQSLSKLAAYI